MVRLAIDGRPLVGNRTGIGVHTAEIAGRLGFTPPPLIASHREITERRGVEECRFDVVPSFRGVWWQQVHFPAVVRRHECEVVWGPHGTLPLRLDVPAVVSVHDLTSITMAHRHRTKTVLSFNLLIGASLERAITVAAVSQTTAGEVMRGFGIPARKIGIVPNGVDPFFSPGTGDPLPEGISDDFVLYTGTIEPRKGIGDLLAAWRQLPSPRPQLVLCGDPGWGTRQIRRELARYAPSEVMVTGFVSREDLRALYRRARLFVYPSRFEGFGLPPLEAMACGTAVVAARGGAIPEVLGDAAELIEPGDVEGLRRAMRRVLEEPTLRDELLQRGIERAALFSWDASASRMRELIRAAANREGER
ncbi:MAG: glycosyltransferase family 1 protein [Thermoanaerobaculia bacterium]